jgi:hypothetical protein
MTGPTRGRPTAQRPLWTVSQADVRSTRPATTHLCHNCCYEHGQKPHLWHKCRYAHDPKPQ